MDVENLNNIVARLQGPKTYMYSKSTDYFNMNNKSHEKFNLRDIEQTKQPMIIPKYFSVINAPHIKDKVAFLDNYVTVFRVSSDVRNIVINISDYTPPSYDLRNHTEGEIKQSQLSFGPLVLDKQTLQKKLLRFENYKVDKIEVLSLLKITTEHIKNSRPIKMWDYTVYINECIMDKTWYTFTKDGMISNKSVPMINLFHTPCYLRGQASNTHIYEYKKKGILYDS